MPGFNTNFKKPDPFRFDASNGCLQRIDFAYRANLLADGNGALPRNLSYILRASDLFPMQFRDPPVLILCALQERFNAILQVAETKVPAASDC